MATVIEELPATNATQELSAQQKQRQATAKAHGFSGKTVIVELLKTAQNEPKDCYVSLNDYSILIQRGVKTEIFVEVYNHMLSLQYTMNEAETSSAGNIEWVDRQRLSFNVHRQ